MNLRSPSVWFGVALLVGSACGVETPVAGDRGGAETTGGGSDAGATPGAGGGGNSGTGGAGPSSGTGPSAGAGGNAGSSGSATGGAAGSSMDDAAAADAQGDAAGGDGGVSLDAAMPRPDGGSRRAVLIWGHGEHLPTPKPTDAPMPFDLTMKARLEAKGLAVDMIVDQISTVADVTDKALLVISSSINRDNLFDNKQARFKAVPVPTIVMKDGTIEVMGLGAGGAGGFSTDVGQTQLSIVAPGDPLAAGLTGNVTVYTKGDRLIWAKPGAAAKKIATIVGHADEVGIFAYAAGAAMVDGTAPAKRMAFFIHRNTDYSPDGLKLFDAAVDYLLAP